MAINAEKPTGHAMAFLARLSENIGDASCNVAHAGDEGVDSAVIWPESELR